MSQQHAPGDRAVPRHHDDHDHSHGCHDGGRRRGLHGRVWRLVTHGMRPHAHHAGADAALESSAEGIRVVRISLAVLAMTSAVQVAVVMLSGSVALLGDALHNAADALTAVPLGVAFLLGRRAPTRRYTYGYGRAEDLAGILIVVIIAATVIAAAVAAAQRLVHPRPVTHLAAVAIAAGLGFAGNELVAGYRIRTGRRIGSAALVADGLHARADGFTSLAVLAGAAAVAAGWHWADPVAGLLITVAIASVGWQAGLQVLRRLMDSVDPELTETAEHALCAVPGVLGTRQVRLRWIGHRMRAECEILVGPELTAAAAHQIAVAAEHTLLHAIPRLTAAIVHADPADGTSQHAILVDHTTGAGGGVAVRAAQGRRD